jgi:hypothetical protein
VIKYLRFTGLSTDIYISYAMKLRKLRTLKNDKIGPCPVQGDFKKHPEMGEK